MPASPAIFWFRDDLRLDDNPGLAAAGEDGRPVIPVFIRETGPNAPRPEGGASQWWRDKSLTRLSKSIANHGGRLILRMGDPQVILHDLIETTGATAVCWNRRYDEAGRNVDTTLKSSLRDRGVDAHSAPGNVLAEPWTIQTQQGGPYKVFTPYWRALREAYANTPERMDITFARAGDLACDDLPDWRLHPRRPDWSGGLNDAWTPGASGALDRLEDLLDNRLDAYAENRDRPDLEATSRLSPHIHFGEISVHRIWRSVRSAMEAGRVSDTQGWKFLSELAWRDFSHHLLFHFPTITTGNFRDTFDAFPWRADEDAIQAWRCGQTGYPIVDAGMRELWTTGWMHNRVRMIVASFLCKHLLAHWKKGEAWFWDTLVDADVANNAASWQWVAGSGADAAPYFRIFNPITQGEKFDPQGDYVRKWVPEIAALPDACLHSPWTASATVLKKAGVALGATYPKPIVDHATARQRALDAYESARK